VLTGSVFDATAALELDHAPHVTEQGGMAVKLQEALARVTSDAAAAAALAPRIRVDGSGQVLRVHVRDYDPRAAASVAMQLAAIANELSNQDLTDQRALLLERQRATHAALVRLNAKIDLMERNQGEVYRSFTLDRLNNKALQMRHDYHEEEMRVQQALAGLPDHAAVLAENSVHPVSPWSPLAQRGLAALCIGFLAGLLAPGPLGARP